MNDSAELKQRGEACDRLIKLGKLAGSELAGAYFGRGRMKWNANQPEPAIADYSEAVKHNPNHHVAYNNRGALYLYSKNDLPNALRDFSEAIRIDPKFALALANRAEVLRRQGKLSEALADANKAIEIDQKHARALSVRDAIQADVKRIEEEKARTAQASADHQLCMNTSADVKQRGEACDRLINLGKLTGSELAKAYFGRGRMRWNANQIEPAIADYSEAIKHNPNGYLGYNNRGAIYLDRNDLPNALRDFNEAIRNNQSNALAFANRAEALRRQGKLSEALADANKAIEIDQKLAFAVSVRNAIQADVKRNEEEENSSADRKLCMNSSADVKLRGEACDRLIKLGNLAGSDLATAYFGRARMRHNDNQVEPAMSDYSEALKHNPNHDMAYNNRGTLYLRNNDLPNALRDFSEAIRIDPRDALFLANRADVLSRQGKLSEALAEVNKAIEIDQKHARALFVRDAIQADIKRIEEQGKKPPAQTQSNTESHVNPTLALRARAQAHLDKRDYASAIADFTELIRGGNSGPADYNARGSAYHHNRQLDLAMADYARAIASSGHDWRPHFNRAAIYDMRDELDNALRDLNAAIGDHGGNEPSVFILRGRVHLQKAAHEPAWADFNKAVELAPDNPQAYLLRGMAHSRMMLATIEDCRNSQNTRTTVHHAGGPCSRPPNFTPALEDFKTAVAKKPDYAEPHFETGRIMANEGQHESAVRAYSAAIRAEPKYSMAYNSRGVAYFNLKKRELALADYEEAIRTDPRNKFAWANRASLLASMGQRQRAIADYRKALDIDQNYAFALEGLRRLGIKP